MRRRDFISLVGGAAVAWPLAARAQQPAMRVIGVLSTRSPVVDAPLLAVVRQGLNETGFVEGRNIAIDYRWSDGRYDRLAELAAELVRRQVAVIVTMGGEVSALAAKAATATVPVVFVGGTDPVRSGLVTSLHRPGGNITGVSTFFAEIEPKRLGLLRELRDNARTIAALVNPNSPYGSTQMEDVEIAARGVGQDIVFLKAATIREVEAAFERVAQLRVDAMLVMADALFFNRAAQLVVLAARSALPTLYFRREFAAAGGLMSYGSNVEDSYRVLGLYAGRILKGEKPGDLPIQLPTKFELLINLATARALRIDIPSALLTRADEVIE